jgi:hypothetical protein
VQAYADSVKNNVREIALDINYDHREHTGKAAGWIRDAADRGPDGLWIAIEFTEPAREAIKTGEYRYMSSEFSDEWEHPKSGQKFKDVFFGAALTNRPYIKDILPINMSEVNGGESVDKLLQAMRAKFKLSDDATEDEILEAFSKDVVEPKKEEDPKNEPITAVLSEEQLETLKKLAEDHPAMKGLSELVQTQSSVLKTQAESIAQLQAAAKLSEAQVMLNDFTKPSEGAWAIPPAALEGMPKLLSEMPPGHQKAFGEFVTSILKTGLVQLGEKGVLRQRGDAGKSAGELFTESVEKHLSEDPKMSYADAVSRVSADDPDLWESYRLETLES